MKNIPLALDDEDYSKLQEVCKKLKLKMVQAIREAIRLLHKKEIK